MIAAKLTGEAIAVAVRGVAVVASTWVLKKIPNATIKAKVGVWMYGLGVTLTLGMAKWKYTKKLWNKVIEPWVVDAVDNILVTGLSKFVEGMRSDND